ncbi:MAG: PQQ-dependent sugar dehydrogenase [Gemmatimonadota bacterium]|nr:PQQ-dependent sugar dehydrogenase [Gemmatimonadota bacterium]MDH5759006.1 PQQ-dependent sugar dehydrogenase [Gemmatimonadota bacterium]
MDRTSVAIAATLLGFACSPSVPAPEAMESMHHSFTVATVVDGLEHPWGLAFLPGGDLLVTERAGRLRVVRDGVLVDAPVGGVPRVGTGGQGGLLDVALHPDFARNQLVYLSFSKPGEGDLRTTAVVRGRFDGSELTDVEEIFEADAWTDRGVHFGSRLVFDGTGHVFVSVGDRGQMDQAQNPGNHQGTIVRLYDDGRVPEDNPFVGREGFRPEIWAYGIRSPQGLTFHPETGELWEVEHGPRGGDEINWIRPGLNYGWPVISYGINYDGTVLTELTEREGMEQPLHYWVPSIATSGLTVYAGDAFPAWRGSAFVGGLAGMHLARIAFDGHEVTETERLLDGMAHRIRDVREGPDGFLYVLVDEPDAPLLRIEPAR